MLTSQSASPILYHKTGIHNLIGILKSKKLDLSPSQRSSVEVNMNREYPFYFSFGRTLTAKYNKLSVGTAQLVFDGNVLGSRHKFVPVDYWGEDYRKHSGGDYEQEDRLVSDKAKIDLIGLKEVHCYLSGNLSDTQKRQSRTLLLLCKRMGVKLYVYTNQKAAQYMKRSESLPLQALNLKTDKPIVRYRERPDKRDSGAHAVVELLLKKAGQQLSEPADRYLRYIHYGEFETQYSIVIGSYLNSSGKEKNKVLDLIQLTKKLKLKTAKEVAAYIKAKWA